MREAAVGVLLLAAGRLDDAVEAHEVAEDDPHARRLENRGSGPRGGRDHGGVAGHRRRRCGGGRRARGARVGLIARTADDLDGVLARVGGTGVAVAADVAERTAIVDALAQVESALGPIDVLVANAGIGAYGPFVDMSFEEIERVVHVNVLGTIYAIRAVLPGMVARRRGHVVTIGSIAGRIGSPFEAVYSATKFAGVGLTEAFAVEVAPYGIGVSIVNPGVVATDFGDARGHPYDRERPKPISAEAVADAVVAAIERGTARGTSHVGSGPRRWCATSRRHCSAGERPGASAPSCAPTRRGGRGARAAPLVDSLR